MGRLRQRFWQRLRQRQPLSFLPLLSLAAEIVVGNALCLSVWSNYPSNGIRLPILRARQLPDGAFLPDPRRLSHVVSLFEFLRRR